MHAILGASRQQAVSNNALTDLSQELLQKLSAHPDPVASKLSKWVLSFRFAPDGAIRPLLTAIEHGTPDDTRH
jgi:hypothetical protein